MELLLRILHLEDEPFDSEVVRELLGEENLEAIIHRVDTLTDFQQSLERGWFDLILSDYTLPGVDTFEALHFARERAPEVPFIFYSGTIGEDTAIESLKMGASDYVLKHRPARLGSAVKRALQETKEQARRHHAEQALKQNQEALRRSETWLRLALEAADLGTWDWYPLVSLLFCSSTCKAMFGLPPEVEPSCSLFVSRIHPEDVEPTLEHIQKATEAGGTGKLNVEFRSLQSNDAYRWLRVKGRSIFAGQGKHQRVIRTAGTIQDVTERKEAQMALHDANEALEHNVRERTAQLQETVAELEQFSYTITHDMRAPLRAMHSFGELLLREPGALAQPRHRAFMQRIVEAAERMDELITDALDYTKILRQELVLTNVDTHALLQGIIESYPQLQPPKANISIEENIPNVLGNAAGLTQVFANLLNNAVTFVEPGKTPQVRIWAEEMEAEGQAWVRIWVEDNGIGIPQDAQERIWEMFQRLSETHEGTGIGLALVRKVMQRMGGKTAVESQPGQGSRFWVQLRKATEA